MQDMSNGQKNSTGTEHSSSDTPVLLSMAAGMLTACGGAVTTAVSPVATVQAASAVAGASISSTNSVANTAGMRMTAESVTVPVVISDAQASRFLAQASVGANRTLMTQVQATGYAGWLNQQMAMAPTKSRWDWLIDKGFNASTNQNTENGFDAAIWNKLFSSPDTLRQRVTLALSEMLVVGIDGIVSTGWRAFAAANYLDVLEANCFGNYRNLLYAISKTPAMGQFLTFVGSVKFNPATGALPDENYARELMQLFSIGLVQLNIDGTSVLANGMPVSTYGLNDITGLARIFTGWEFDRSNNANNPIDYVRRPLIQIPSHHETGASTFLGKTVQAGLNGEQSLNAALDIIFAHPNVAPFVGKQLIQRLVTSNPSAAYVSRVAMVFNNDGTGVRGNLAAVIKAILLDSEARSDANVSNPDFGKLREPMLRMLNWARAYNVNSVSTNWLVGNTSDPGTRLGQSPLRSPSVFNFFWPGYVPPNTSIATAGLVAPEFQITDESTVAGYINYMQHLISLGNTDLLPDYSSLSALAANSAALLTEINLVLAAGQLSNSTINNLTAAINSMPLGTTARLNNRVYAALLLVMAAPEFIVLK